MASPRALRVAFAALCVGVAACSSAAPGGVSAPKARTGTGQGAPFFTANVTGVSCASTSLCAAVGINFDSSAKGAPLASSTDGGLTWTLDHSVASADTEFTSVACGVDGCLSVGRSLAGALVYRLAPGSTSWTETARPAADALGEATACAARRWCAVIFHDETHRWMATTLNGGREWSDAGNLPATTSAVYQLSCSDALHCIASGIDPQGNALIIVTADGGMTWTAGNLGMSRATRVWDVVCQSDTSCTAIVDLTGAPATAVLTSDDGGATFSAPTPPITKVTAPRSVSCSLATCVIVGADRAGHGMADVVGPAQTSKAIDLTYAPTPLLWVSCATPGRCVAAGFGSLVALSPSVPNGSQQQRGQFRN